MWARWGWRPSDPMTAEPLLSGGERTADGPAQPAVLPANGDGESPSTVREWCVAYLGEMGHSPAAIDSAVSAVGGGHCGAAQLREASDALCCAHPSPQALNWLAPLTSSRAAGTYVLTAQLLKRFKGDAPHSEGSVPATPSYGSFADLPYSRTAPPDAASASAADPRHLQSTSGSPLVRLPGERAQSVVSPTSARRRLVQVGLAQTRHAMDVVREFGIGRGGGGVLRGLRHTRAAGESGAVLHADPTVAVLGQSGAQSPTRASITGGVLGGRSNSQGDFPRAFSAPTPQRHGAVPQGLVPGAAWAHPRGLTLLLLRCIAAEGRCGEGSEAAGELRTLVAQGQLMNQQLRALLRRVEEAPHHADSSAAASEAAAPAEEERECSICLCGVPSSEFVAVGCGNPDHGYCRDCMQMHIEQTVFPKCPGDQCGYELTEGEVEAVCGEGERLKRFREARLQAAVDVLPGLVRCPRDGCQNAILVQEEDGRLPWKCELCKDSPAICTVCREPYHYLLDCGEMQEATVRWREWEATGRAALHGREVDEDKRKQLEDAHRQQRQLVADERWKMENCRYCPHCGRVSHKTDGCNSMICGKDAPDKGSGNVQKGCQRAFDWARARPYKPVFNQAELARLQACDGPAPSPTASPTAVHRGVTCAKCGVTPVRGVLIECLHCPAERRHFCSTCDSGDCTTQEHSARHVCRVRTDGDEESAEHDPGDALGLHRLVRDAEERERLEGERYRRQEAQARRAERLQRCRRCAALCLLLGLLGMQLYAITSQGFVKAPDTLECSGDVATYCHCAPTPAPAPVETVEVAPPTSEYYRTWWMIIILIVGGAAALHFMGWVLRAGNERCEYGADDDDYKEYRNHACVALLFLTPFLVMICLGANESARKSMLGTEEVQLTPPPPPVPPEASPSAGDYYSTWWVIMLMIGCGLSFLVCCGGIMAACCDNDDEDDREEILKFVSGCFFCCVLPPLIFIFVGTNSAARLTLLGPAGNDTAANATNSTGQPMMAVTPTVSEYYSAVGIVICMVGLGITLCLTCGAFFIGRVADEQEFVGIAAGCCACCVLPLLIFVLLGLNPAAREKLLPTKLVPNTTLGTSSPSVHSGIVWTAEGSQWCGLTSCASVESMLDFLFPFGRPSKLDHMLRAATGLASTAAACQGMSILVILRTWNINGVTDALLMGLACLTCIGFCSELSAWSVLAALYTQDACDDGFALREAVTLGPNMFFLVANTFVWPCILFFALIQSEAG